MKTQLHELNDNHIISTDTLVQNILHDRISTIHHFVDEQVALKRTKLTRGWSMKDVLASVEEQFGSSAIAIARNYLIQHVFNLDDYK